MSWRSIQTARTLLAAPLLALVCGLLPAPAAAQINCNALPHWTATNPRVNQIHVFCGEWSGSAPKGFHSRPGGPNQTPATIGGFNVTQAVNGQGVYGGTWWYAGHPGVTKSSTMFPDACSMQEVLNSILYAAAHQIMCPPGAPNWAACGANRPNPVPPGAGPYCGGGMFVIAMGFVNNDVNTAFPLY